MQVLERFHSMSAGRLNINHTYVTLESNGMQYINGKHTTFWTTIKSKHGRTPLTFTLEHDDAIRLTAKFGDEVISIVYKEFCDVPLRFWLNTHIHYWTTQATHKKVTAPEAAPTVETTEPAPTVETTEPAPTVETTEPAPIVEPTEPAPTVETTEPAPTVETTEPAPIVEPTETTPTNKRQSSMNTLFQKIKDTFTQAQGKRVTTQGTYVTVVSVEHVRHNAGSARLVNRRWSDDMAHDELIVTFRSKNGNSRLVLTAFDHDTDDVRYEHLQDNVVCFFGKIVDEDDIDVKGWCMEHVVITQ